MDLLTGAGLAAPAGLNAYIPLLTVGLLNRFTDLVELDSPYDILSSDAGLIVLSILLVIELFADAIPGLDSINDMIQTVIRPAAGAFVMFAAGDGGVDMHPLVQALIGGGLAGGVHAIKAVGRPIVTVTTGGLGNAAVSTGENALALVLSLIAILVPALVLAIGIILAILTVRWLVRGRNRVPTGDYEGQ
jgi:hypothetical protein